MNLKITYTFMKSYCLFRWRIMLNARRDDISSRLNNGLGMYCYVYGYYGNTVIILLTIESILAASSLLLLNCRFGIIHVLILNGKYSSCFHLQILFYY